MALQTPAGVALGHIYALHRDAGAGIPPAGAGLADHFALSRPNSRSNSDRGDGHSAARITAGSPTNEPSLRMEREPPVS